MVAYQLDWAEGECPRCGQILRRKRPIDVGVCDCYRYCPVDHGKGKYGTLMTVYSPDMTPQTYGPIESEGTIWGDLEHPMHILFVCPTCNYHSSQTAVEVQLE